MTITRSPRALAWLVVGATAILALLGLLVWQGAAHAAVAGARITYDAEPLRCDGAPVGLLPGPTPDAEYSDDLAYELFFDHEFHTPVVDLTPGMRCALRIQVINDGWSEVTVTQIALHFFGEEAALRFEPLNVSPNGVRIEARPPTEQSPDSAFDDMLDAGFTIDGGIRIPPGWRESFIASFTYDGNAEMSECGSMTVNVPRVTVEALGRSAVLQPLEEQGISFRQPGDDCS